MWDEIHDVSEAMEREYTLKNLRWSSLLAAGARYERFDNTFYAAWNIVRGFGDTRKALLLQKELVDKKMSLDDTAAGRQLQRQRDTMEDVALFSNHQNHILPTIDPSKIVPNDNVILHVVCLFSYAYLPSTQALNRNRRSIKITGLIYTRRITEQDRTGAELASFQALYRLCGHDDADRVRLVTTMWDEVDAESDVQHTEDNLQIMHWKSLIDAGAHYTRFNNTPESAWEIIHSLGDAKMTLTRRVGPVQKEAGKA
ncbi:hypothetical protein ID866_10416, partial [Astraeus odoratus]